MGLLHAPLQWLLDTAGAGLEARLLSPHLLQTALTLACLYCVYRYLRAFFPPAWAHLGAVLLSLNRLTVHYAGFVLSDIPSALFLILFLWLQTPGRTPDRLRSWLSPAALLACLLSRWNMLMVPFLLIGTRLGFWAGCGFPKPQGRKLRGLALTCALALAVFAVVCAALYRRVFGCGWADAFRLLAVVLNVSYRAQAAAEPFWTYGEAVLVCAGPVAVLAALNGLRLALKKPRGEFSFNAALLLGFAAVMSLGVGHKEFRYLYAVLPLFYLLAVAGLRDLWERASGLPRAARLAGAGVLLASALAGAVREWTMFADPVYRTPLQTDLARQLRRHATSGSRLFWTGASYSQVPKTHELSPRDAFYYLYHVPCAASAAYLAGQPVYDLRLEKLARKPPLPLSLRLADLDDLREGDLIIEAPSRTYLNTDPLEPRLNRLELRVWSRGALKKLAVLPAEKG